MRCVVWSLWFLLVTPTVLLAVLPSPPQNIAGQCGNSDYYLEIRSLWDHVRPEYEELIKGSGANPYNLYVVQHETNNLLKYAGYCMDIHILDELASLYLGAFETLGETDDYIFSYYLKGSRQSTHKLHKKYQMWLDDTGMETILVSSQFLYLLSNALHIISKVEPTQHTLAMKCLVASAPGILFNHYDRWVFDTPGPFQVRGWGCEINGKYVETGMNHLEFIRKKINRQLGDRNSPSYCNAVTDTDMWIVAGMLHLLAAYQNDTIATSLPEKYGRYFEYLRAGVELLKSRVTYKSLQDWNGKLVLGANFDLGVWKDHQTFDYVNYKMANFPNLYNAITIKLKVRAKEVGWDISHARRFVHVFDTLYENKEILGLDFPDEDFMKKLTNQFVYGVFNGDFTKPLFVNFMDGTNGWYRVGYRKRIGFGYGLWGRSIAALTGGYGFWSRYNKDYEKLYCALVDMIHSDDPEVQKHVQKYYEKQHWQNYKRKKLLNFKEQSTHIATQRVLIQFLPTLCFLRRTNLGDYF